MGMLDSRLKCQPVISEYYMHGLNTGTGLDVGYQKDSV